MMSNTTVTGKVVSVKYAGASHYGNPAYFVTLDNDETYRTMSDAMISYAIENPEYRDEPHVFTLTRAGRIRSARTVANYLATSDCKDKRAREVQRTGETSRH